MLFRRTIFSAVILGVIAGLVLSLAQLTLINPIILAAETYESQPNPQAETQSIPTTAMSHHDSHMGGQHGHTAVSEEQGHKHSEAWEPAPGLERNIYSIAANISVAIGLSAMLLAVMSQTYQLGLARLNLGRGLLWGAGGYTAFFVMPAIGLPPEIPGVEAAAVEHRQQWWLFTVASTAVALLLLAFAPKPYKLLTPLLLAAPFLIGIPHPLGPAFTHPDAAVVNELKQLHQKFIVITAFISAGLWLIIGAGSNLLLERWVVADRCAIKGQ